MGFNAVPPDEKAVFCWVFDDPFQRHALATRVRFEQGSSLRNGSFKDGGIGRINGEGCDFGDQLK
jgi:hypothetical protein